MLVGYAISSGVAQSPLPDSFNPGANDAVSSLVVQPDGKILVGGGFSTLGGQPRGRIARLNADGTVDAEFNPGANGRVESLVLQSDGKILVGGVFGSLAGEARRCLGRLKNFQPAPESLAHAGLTITWLRGGTCPEVWRTTFDHSTDGITWTALNTGTRIPGGWQLSRLNLLTAGTIRARGYVAGGLHNGSAGFVETLLGGPVRLSLRRGSSQVLLTWTGGQGPYQVQQTTDPGASNSWVNVGKPVQTNSMTLPIGSANLFLRVRGQ